MKSIIQYVLVFAGLFFSVLQTHAQQDATLLTVNGKPVGVSEFLYSYKKNNTDGVIDRKGLEEYLDLFINYKLKVCAAEEAQLDTLQSFIDEFRSYRNPQLVSAFVSDADVEAEAQQIYTDARNRCVEKGGMRQVAHISAFVQQRGNKDAFAQAKQRMEEVSQKLKAGEDFADLALQYSDDKISAEHGGVLGWLEKGQIFKEFENAVYALDKGGISEPFETPAGWHIVKVLDSCDYLPYDTVHASILQYIDSRNIRQNIMDKKLRAMAAEQAQGGAEEPSLEALLQEKADELSATDEDLRNLLREYHDGLLLYEIMNREIWEKVSNDEAALTQYFKKNKKKYTWDSPRYKGMAYHVKDAADVKAVKKAVKGLAFDKWNEKLRSTFNADSVLRIRVEKGLFKQGDSPLVDREVFKQQVQVKTNADYPIDAVYGKLLKSPEELNDVRAQVVSDLQEEKEREWVAQLRKKYEVVVDREVLAAIKE